MQSTPSVKRKLEKPAIGWLTVCGCLLLLSFVLGRIDDATELAPDHSNVIGWDFATGVVVALVGAVVLWPTTNSWPAYNRIGFTIASSFLSFLAVSMTLLPASEIVEGWIDFPPAKTVTYRQVPIAISRAYRTHGKGQSWNIQTMPLWSNIEISEDDYAWMLANRRPGDVASGPDEIKSEGYFCVLASIQKAGDAIRILHAGRAGLPRGSIELCPSDIGKTA